MQSNPRILVNLLVILVKILVNLLVKPTKLGLGGPGGAYPLLEPLVAVFSPPPQIGVPWGLGPGNALGRGSYAWSGEEPVDEGHGYETQ